MAGEGRGDRGANTEDKIVEEGMKEYCSVVSGKLNVLIDVQSRISTGAKAINECHLVAEVLEVVLNSPPRLLVIRCQEVEICGSEFSIDKNVKSCHEICCIYSKLMADKT